MKFMEYLAIVSIIGLIGISSFFAHEYYVVKEESNQYRDAFIVCVNETGIIEKISQMYQYCDSIQCQKDKLTQYYKNVILNNSDGTVFEYRHNNSTIIITDIPYNNTSRNITFEVTP